MAEQLKAREKPAIRPKPRLGGLLAGDIIETNERLNNKLNDTITKNPLRNPPIDWKGAMDLIKAGADIEAKNFFGRTALMVAAAEGEIKVCKFLLDNGANIRARDTRFGETPIMRAVKNGKNDVCRLLIGKGADVNTSNSGGWTPLMQAAKANDLSTCQVLLEKGADMRIHNVAGHDAKGIAKSSSSMDAYYFILAWKLNDSIGMKTAKGFVRNFRECVRNS